MRSRGARASKKATGQDNPTVLPQEQDCYEGDRLEQLLKSVQGKIATARASDGNVLPEKIWLKQQFAIGVNEVTRLLERMPECSDKGSSLEESAATTSGSCKAAPLQAVIVAWDCNPKWLIRHLLTLASSRKVPLIFVKDKKKGSSRLGEVVKLKTAMAIGVKAKGSAINGVLEKILGSGKLEGKVIQEAEEILQ